MGRANRHTAAAAAAAALAAPGRATATEENALTGCANLLDELSSPV